MNLSAQDCTSLDQNDPLRKHHNRFIIAPGMIYLDGNSLGALPAMTGEAITQVIKEEWGADLIQSWNKAGWFDLPATLGDRIGTLVGAASGQIVVSDNTSINLFKAVHAALGLNADRSRTVAHQGDFPTDLYMIDGAANSCGRPITVDLIENESNIVDQLNDQVAVAVLSQVNYKTGALLDMAAVTEAAHQAGVLVVWDLCHSAGAMSVDLDQCNVDFAVGCTYKYLNGGPGSPAFIYAAKRHHADMYQPVSGWWSHAKPFDFNHQYAPADGIKRMLSGTQSVLALKGVGCGLDTFNDVTMAMIRQKSVGLCNFFIQLVNQECTGMGLSIVGPTDASERGSHVSIACDNGYPLMQAIIERGVVGDFRSPNLMRFGFAPLYLSYQQIWDAVAILKDCLVNELWKDPKYQRVSEVT